MLPRVVCVFPIAKWEKMEYNGLDVDVTRTNVFFAYASERFYGFYKGEAL